MNFKQLAVLDKAREVYGNKNQIMVAIEELNELACILCKYPRYDTHDKALEELKDKVLDEVADVNIVLDHVKSIFSITAWDLELRIDEKVTRVNRWLNTSDSMSQTTIDRALPGQSSRQNVGDGICRFCIHEASSSCTEPCSICTVSNDKFVLNEAKYRNCDYCIHDKGGTCDRSECGAIGRYSDFELDEESLDNQDDKSCCTCIHEYLDCDSDTCLFCADHVNYQLKERAEPLEKVVELVEPQKIKEAQPEKEPEPTKEEEPVEHHCYNCMYADNTAGEGVCFECDFENNNWKWEHSVEEPEVPEAPCHEPKKFSKSIGIGNRTCGTCRYEEESAYDEPCTSCKNRNTFKYRNN